MRFKTLPTELTLSARALGAALSRHDPAIYALWAGLCTIASARQFYGYMMMQTGGEWSAPLDDVFIHFDYARATAQGHPFEWFAGNGFSSGNTSLSYPFVLALGYALGFQGALLMKWAAIVAMVSVFATLLIARRLVLRSAAARSFVPGAPKLGSYLLPPLVLGLGALDWSLWSGMEVAFFLAVWAAALAAFFAVEDATDSRRASRARWLGAAGVALVVTRPEAASTVAAFAIAAALHPKPASWRERFFTMLRAGVPAALALGVQAVANKALTGEFSASGAIVKLAVNNPFLSTDEKIADYIQNLRYATFRNLEYHFTDWVFVDFLIPVLALLALAVRETRRYAAMIWAQLVSWMLIVALNGQVRWQNERYTMPAVAWLLVCAGLGACALLRRAAKPSVVIASFAAAMGAHLLAIGLRPPNTIPELRLAWTTALACGAGVAVLLRVWETRAVIVVGALLVAHDHQTAKMRDQKWFFGRACRNIRDQHLRAGELLGALQPRRLLVGDAGALIYASNRPGLDIIGLGGYHDLPFARAGVHGLAASIELVERMPASERPDVLAIYPSWWGVLPTWFSSEVIARVPAPGNVICGGYEDVLYKADWHVLGTGEEPRVDPGRVRDALDVADLVSEGEHGYEFTRGAGWTDMKILPDPVDAASDMFDGGRRFGPKTRMHFTLSHLEAGRLATLVLRSAPDGDVRVRVRVGGAEIGKTSFAPRDGWDERTLAIDGATIGESIVVELENEGPGELSLYHVWIGQ